MPGTLVIAKSLSTIKLSNFIESFSMLFTELRLIKSLKLVEVERCIWYLRFLLSL